MPEVKELDRGLNPVTTQEMEKEFKNHPEIVQYNWREQVLASLSTAKLDTKSAYRAIELARRIKEAKKRINLSDQDVQLIELSLNQQEKWPAFMKVSIMEGIVGKREPIEVKKSEQEKTENPQKEQEVKEEQKQDK